MMTSLLLLFSIVAQPTPNLWYGRVIQLGASRVLCLAGRNLWNGPEHVDSTTPLPNCYLERASRLVGTTPEMFPLTLWPAEGANGQDGNRALPYLQFWTIPNSVPEDRMNGYIVRFVSNAHAGKPGVPGNPVLARVGPVETISSDNPPYLLSAGEIHGLDVPLLVKANTTFDGRGVVLVPKPTFKGSSLVVLETGANLTQTWVHVPAFSGIGRAIATPGPTRNVRIKNCHVTNKNPDGIAIDLRSAENALIEGVTIDAARSIDCNPNDTPRRNTFVNICCSSARQTRDGQGSRGWGGDENLLLWCQWCDMDRAITLSPQGSPLSRITMFECRQSRTGTTEGASEGLLIEAKKHFPAELTKTPAGWFLRTFGRADEFVRPGYVVTFHDGTKRWARLREVLPQEGTNGEGYQVWLDRDLGPMIQQKVLVGNALVEANILRPYAENGKGGIVLWCGSIDCAIIGGDFRRLRYGIYRMARMNPPGDVCFQWNLTLDKGPRHPLNFFEQVLEPITAETAERPR